MTATPSSFGARASLNLRMSVCGPHRLLRLGPRSQQAFRCSGSLRAKEEVPADRRCPSLRGQLAGRVTQGLMAPPVRPDRYGRALWRHECCRWPGLPARHRGQVPRSRCFYCVTPHARAQTVVRGRSGAGDCSSVSVGVRDCPLVTAPAGPARRLTAAWNRKAALAERVLGLLPFGSSCCSRPRQR